MLDKNFSSQNTYTNLFYYYLFLLLLSILPESLVSYNYKLLILMITPQNVDVVVQKTLNLLRRSQASMKN